MVPRIKRMSPEHFVFPSVYKGFAFFALSESRPEEFFSMVCEVRCRVTHFLGELTWAN